MANVRLLSDMMNTKYIINSLSGRFTNVLNEAAKEGIDLDLAGCKFGPTCQSILRDWYAKINFFNSEDVVCDDILRRNMEAARTEYESYEPLYIKKNINLDEVINLIETLPQGGKYDIVIDLSDIVCKAAIALLIMARPDLEYDLRRCCSDVFDFVRDSWISSAEHHEKYYELIAPNIITRDMRSDEYYGSDDSGWYKEPTFIRKRKVLPVEFGNSQIIKLDGKPVEEWRAVITHCLDIFDGRVEKERAKGKTIKDFLKVREV